MMQKYIHLKLGLLFLLSVLLFLLLIVPDVKRSLQERDRETASFSGTLVDSETTEPKEEESDGTKDITLRDVVCEIADPSFPVALQYERYPLTYTYLVIEEGPVSVYSGPAKTEAVIRQAEKYEKLNYVETIFDEETWYHVTWEKEGAPQFGFLHQDDASRRMFQFELMDQAIQKAENAFSAGKITYIRNYKNAVGMAPAYHGTDVDADGNRRSQSAPAYLDLADRNEFIYLGDGTLVRAMERGEDFTKVSLLKNNAIYFVPSKYVASDHVISGLKKVIAIDRRNQNEAVFEKGEEDRKWKMISYTLATTGTKGKYHQPTPLGYYYAIEKRERFYYYEDGTTHIQGYAPYAVRFAGGAYVHGVPVNYKYTADGKRNDPGKIEYSKTMGTIPLSHKCVRNYTSHAKFIYDWYSPGETVVIVIE